MKNVHDINGDLRVEIEGESIFLWVKEDGFDGKVEALTKLSRDDATELRDRLNDFLEH